MALFYLAHSFRRRAAGLAAAILVLSAGAASAQMALPGKFEVNAAGAATYSVPIVVPPGTAGMIPSLTLDYNSQGGNGILGLGWSLGGLPSIGRCAPTIAQDGARAAVTYTSNDRFCMEGQRLVAVNGNYGADGIEYRTEIESFTRIIAKHRDADGSPWFEVHTKSGHILQLGNSRDSQARVQCTSTIRSWAVNQVSDTAGNYYTVTYANDTGCNGTGQVVPIRIVYTGNVAGGVSPYNTVEFTYQGRTDNLLAYEAGAQQNTRVLLTGIAAYAGATLATQYNIGYSQTLSTGRSILTSIAACDAGNSCLPATTFSWNTGSDNFSAGALQGWSAPGGGPGVGFAQADLNGDGKADGVAYHFTSNNTLQVYGMLSVGNGTFSSPQLSEFNGGSSILWSGGINTSPVNISLADVNGDGLPDLVAVIFTMSSFQIYVALGNGDGTFGSLSGWNSGALGGDWSNNCIVVDATSGETTWLWSVAAVDIDGDGRADVIAYCAGTSGIVTFTSLWTGNGFAAPVEWKTPGAYLSAWLADVNGDGRTDLVSAAFDQSGFYVTAALSNGDGSYGRPQSSQQPGNFLRPGDTVRWGAASGDVNGDGRTDVVAYYLGMGGYTAIVALSRGDGKFDFQPPWNQAASNLTGFTATLADLNGDGRADFIAYKFDAQIGLQLGVALAQSNGLFATPVTLSTGGFNATNWQFATADIDGDGRSDLIFFAFTGAPSQFNVYTSRAPSTAIAVSSITTGLGAGTNIGYAPLTSASVYSKGHGAAYPQQDIQGPLYVTAEVDAPNGIGGSYTTTYGYSGARLDLQGRGFLGFAEMDVHDLQTGIMHGTFYRQDYPFIGMVASAYKSLASVTLNQTSNAYASTPLGGTGGARSQINLFQNFEQSADLDGSPMPGVVTTYNSYDWANNPTTVTVQTTTPGTNTVDGFAKQTSNTYSYTIDSTRWFIDRLSTSTVTSWTPQSNSTPLSSGTRSSSFGYDATTGLINVEWVEPGTPTIRLEIQYFYDAFGNKIQTTVSGIDIDSRTSSTTYDAFGRFVVRQTNALSQSESWQYDPRFGKPTSHTGPNNLTTTWSYDSFGRKTLEVRADQNRTAWSYSLCDSSCVAGEAYFVQTTPQDAGGNLNGAMSIVYVDTLERETRRYTQGFDGSWILVYTIYDGLGRVQQKTRPLFQSGGAAEWTRYDYDALGRILTEHFPDGSTRQHAYHGLVTIDIDAYARTRIVVKDSQGQVQVVQDQDQSTNILSDISFTYDPFGNVLTTTDMAGNVVSNTYDQRGRKIASNDPDLGAWTYAYDTLGQVFRQTDAKGQTTTFAYDKLGRLLERDEPDMTCAWIYDTAANGIGKLATASITAGRGAGYQRSLLYDGLGRPYEVTTTINNVPLAFAAAYDGNGRLSTLQFPSGVTVYYRYNAYGYANQLSDANTGTAYWTATARDAELHLTGDTLGNGVATSRTFDVQTGRLTGIFAGSSNHVGAFTYAYDFLGNLINRTNYNDGISENLAYDALSRVTFSQVQIISTGQISAANAFGYDTLGLGNLTSKTGVGSYAYPAARQPRPHAVSSISGGTINTTFSYDANGNQTAGLGRSVIYTSYNKPASITQGAVTLSFYDDPDQQRFMQIAPEGQTWYVDAFGARAELVLASVTSFNDYLMVGDAMVGVHINRQHRHHQRPLFPPGPPRLDRGHHR